MKLAQFRHFAKQIREEPPGKAVSIEIYRLTEGKWFDCDDQEISTLSLIKSLNRTFSVKTHWRNKNTNDVFFPIEQIESVAVATFTTAIQHSTRASFNKILRERLNVCINEFDATHDHLTDLLNRGQFDKQLISELVSNRDEGNTSAINQNTQTPSVVLVTVDIDNFKSVNDTHGHLFGDVVLRCIASRLQKAADTLLAETEGRVRLHVARPGGEEFAVAICGMRLPGEDGSIAERIRYAIEGRVTPDEEEWSALRGPDIPTAMELPHAMERRVTVSIGCAEAKGGRTVEETNQAIARAKTNADAALYRAKATGRNRVVKFEDILSSYGRVLEHHPSTNIVAIDLGRNANVRPGQEFLVFHPQFSGKEPFIYTDGRTSKRIGNYPRVSCGRIEVSDIQAEIAFSRVVANDLRGEFPTGCLLEAVPAGSISHLVPQRGIIIEGLATQADLDSWANGIVNQKKFPIAYVVSLLNFTELVEDFGSSSVNKALVRLFVELNSRFGGRVRVGQLVQPV